MHLLIFAFVLFALGIIFKKSLPRPMSRKFFVYVFLLRILWCNVLCSGLFLFKYFIYLFLDRGERREKERKRNIIVWLPLTHSLLGTWPATQACALTGNRTGDPLVRKPVLNSLSHTSQGSIHFFNEGKIIKCTTTRHHKHI